MIYDVNDTASELEILCDVSSATLLCLLKDIPE